MWVSEGKIVLIFVHSGRNERVYLFTYFIWGSGLGLFDLDVVQKYIILSWCTKEVFFYNLCHHGETTAAEVDGKTQKYYVDKSNVTRL